MLVSATTGKSAARIAEDLGAGAGSAGQDISASTHSAVAAVQATEGAANTTPHARSTPAHRPAIPEAAPQQVAFGFSAALRHAASQAARPAPLPAIGQEAPPEQDAPDKAAFPRHDVPVVNLTPYVMGLFDSGSGRDAPIAPDPGTRAGAGRAETDGEETDGELKPASAPASAERRSEAHALPWASGRDPVADIDTLLAHFRR